MLHGENRSMGDDPAAGYKSSLGVKMFVVYALVYAGFVAINVIQPQLMERTVVLGLNLALVYGVGLIVMALILAIFYDKKCAKREAEHAAGDASSAANGKEGQ